MKELLLYVGIDVDDKMFHCYATDIEETTTFEFQCKPYFGALFKKLKELKGQNYNLKVCYEAGYLGNSLYRSIISHGIHCDVVAPSLIPTSPGKKIKTDKLDSKKLAIFYAKGFLTPIHVPDEQEENVRDFIRSRNFLNDQRMRLKLYITSFCRRHGLDYRQTVNKKSADYWTKVHVTWLKEEIKNLKDPSLRMTLNLLLNQLCYLDDQMLIYNEQILKFSKMPQYHQKVQSLCCYRGIKELTAMTVITELGDINRFSHPRKLTSYIGLDIIEYSSGGKEKKYGITKMGNRWVRRILLESSQYAWLAPQRNRRLQLMRKQVDPKFIDIADRCMRRLYKKSLRLLYAGKHRNKVKVAAAREMLGFIWESLRAAA